MTCRLLLISIATVAISGVPALFLHRRSMLGQWVAAILSILGSVLGLAALVVQYIRPDLSGPISRNWALPIGHFAVGIDDISLIFLIPILLVTALGSIYGLSYWPQRRHPGNGRKLRLCWGLMTAEMALLIVARDGILFLMAWEVMALA